ELLALRLQRLLELVETALEESAVRRPVGLVEGTPGGVDRAVHVGLRSVRDLAEHLLRSRVDVRERPRLAVDERAVHEHPRLEQSLTSAGQGDPSSERSAILRRAAAAVLRRAHLRPPRLPRLPAG